MVKTSTFLSTTLSIIAVLAIVSLGLLFSWPYLPLTSIIPSFQSSTAPSLNLNQFHKSKELEDLSTTGDAAWQQLTTTTDGGFLWVRHNDTYRTGWGVSMFHSLHCLGLLREIVKTKSNHNNSHSEHSEHSSHADAAHAGHCLSYIAQSLLCSADGTLERPKSILDKNGDILRDDINGEGVEHRCRDQSLLWELVRQTEQEAINVMPQTRPGDTIWDVFS